MEKNNTIHTSEKFEKTTLRGIMYALAHHVTTELIKKSFDTDDFGAWNYQADALIMLLGIQDQVEDFSPNELSIVLANLYKAKLKSGGQN